MLARMFLSLHPQVRITSKLESNIERQRGKGLIVPTLLHTDKLPLIFRSQVSRVNVGDVCASKCVKVSHSLGIPNSPFPISHGESLMLSDHLQHKFFRVWGFFHLLFTLSIGFLWTSHQSGERGLRKNVPSPTCVPQPEAQSSFMFTLSFKTICSSSLIPACFCLQTQTEGITQRQYPTRDFPITWAILSWRTKKYPADSLFILRVCWKEKQMNTGRRDGPANFLFISEAYKLQKFCMSSWKLAAYLTWASKPTEILFSSVLFIKNWFLVLEKCPKEPKRRQAAFRWGG